MTNQLRCELSAALAAMMQQHVDRLLNLGVPPAATIMCGAARIRTDGKFYECDQNGIDAVILPVLDDGGTADLLAFAPDKPARWWTRRGAHWALGADALDRLWLGAKLKVCRNPLRWLQSGPADNAIVILDGKAARLQLTRIEIVAEDLAHGLELDLLLTIPAQRPLIQVSEQVTA